MLESTEEGTMMKNFWRLLKDKSGVTAIEYGLIAALVGVAIIGGVTLLGGGLNTMFTDVNTTLIAASPVITTTTSP